MSTAPPISPSRGRRAHLGRSLLAAAALVAGALAVTPVSAEAAETGTVTSGTASWGISTYLAAGSPGRPKPLADQYAAPASFDATSKISSWGAGTGVVAPDGSADLTYAGTAVIFAPTGGGWLRLKDLVADLDASGNGTTSAVVSYGTSVTGNPGALTYDPAQAPVRGPERVTLTTLAGNTAADRTLTRTTGTWTGLDGTWSAALLDFLDGDTATAVPAWAYAATISNDATLSGPRTALPVSFTVATEAPAVVADVTSASYDDGLTVDVDGTGFRGVTSPGDAGVYVGLAEAGGLPDVSTPAGMGAFLDAAYVPAAQVSNGVIGAELTAATADLDPAKDYAVYTWQAHAHSNTTQDTETAVDITWADLEPTPAVSVTTTGTSYVDGVDLAVSGSNFRAVTNPGDAGVYVGLAEAGGLPDVSTPAGMGAFLDAAWVGPGQISGGAFGAALHADTAQLDSSKTYAIYTWQAHAHSNTTQDTQTPVSINWASLQPPPPPAPSPAVQVSTTSTSYENGLALSVSGSNFRAVTNPGDAGVYVGLAEAGGLPDVSTQAGMGAFAATAYVSPGQITGGSFTAALNAPTASLDPSKSYAVYTWQAHTHSNTSQDTVTAVSVDWAALEAPPAVTELAVTGPATTVYGTTAELVATLAAGTGTVTLTGVGAAQTVPVTDGKATFTVPAGLAVGDHTATVAYSGDATYPAAEATHALTVTAAKAVVSASWDPRPTKAKGGRLEAVVAGVAGVAKPGGKVRIELLRNGEVVRTPAARTLSNGSVAFGVGKVGKGRWKVRVLYLGAPSYQSAQKVLTFTVR